MSKVKEAPPPVQRNAMEDSSRLAELGMLTASLSHELRQPLFAIKSLVQLLQKQLNGQAGPLTGELLKQVHYLERLVEGVGVCSRRAGEEPVPVDTGTIMHDACELLRHRGRGRGVELHLDCNRELPAALCDPVALLQILVNVINNAIDASPRGGVVSLRHDLEDGRLRLRVRDQGRGVPATDRQALFEPFVTTKAPGEGTGLGLSLSRSLLEAYCGTLDFEDCESGACVVITLERC